MTSDTSPKNQINVLDQGFVRLVDHMGSDDAIVQAARVSYGKGTKKVSEDEGLIRYLLRHAHTTPFEMVQFKFHIKAPIFVFRQWHRHRMWSYNEYSGRYSEMKDEFYVPDADKITKQNPNNKQGGTSEVISYEDAFGDSLGMAMQGFTSIDQLFKAGQSASREMYEQFLGTGMRKELARINLPLAQYSEMYGSVDLHNLFHFLKLRMDSHAQYEIRVYGDALYELIKPIVPIACQAFEEYRLNSMVMFQKDMQGLNQIIQKAFLNPSGTVLDIPAIAKEVSESLFSNKREREEFVNKVSTILSKSV